jgi:hypothetical protein
VSLCIPGIVGNIKCPLNLYCAQVFFLQICKQCSGTHIFLQIENGINPTASFI